MKEVVIVHGGIDAALLTALQNRVDNAFGHGYAELAFQAYNPAEEAPIDPPDASGLQLQRYPATRPVNQNRKERRKQHALKRSRQWSVKL